MYVLYLYRYIPSIYHGFYSISVYIVYRLLLWNNMVLYKLYRCVVICYMLYTNKPDYAIIIKSYITILNNNKQYILIFII